MADENAAYGEVIRGAVAATPDGTVALLRWRQVRAVLMPGESHRSWQELVANLLLPQPGGYLTDALDVPAVTEAGLPAAYLLGADDRSLARPGDEFAARLGLRPVVVPGGHMALLSRPSDIAAAIAGAT